MRIASTDMLFETCFPFIPFLVPPRRPQRGQSSFISSWLPVCRTPRNVWLRAAFVFACGPGMKGWGWVFQSIFVWAVWSFKMRHRTGLCPYSSWKRHAFSVIVKKLPRNQPRFVPRCFPECHVLFIHFLSHITPHLFTRSLPNVGKKSFFGGISWGRREDLL